ncbi:Glycosyl transferase, family 39 [sediment metagenome]|uniref:Glycosyl transferase, family 39 n=1 Tax=sediment metagenome TaxID=749907 RepID=D9PHP5_9ZZZZ
MFVKIAEKPVLSVILLSILCGYLFFFRLGGLALTDPDEPFYAQTAKEMLSTGDWMTPQIYGKPQFEKPIFYYWLVAASFKLFGVNEFAARFPSAVFALTGVIAIYFLGSLLFNRRTGMLAAIILAVNVEYIILSRACITDMVLAALLSLGFLFFFYGYLKDRWYCHLLSGACFALAVLTKGPLFIILPVTAIIAYLFFIKDLKAIWRLPVLGAVAVFILVAGPWYLEMIRMHGKVFIDTFFGFQNVTRFMESEHKMGSQIYYNIPVVFGGFFPWSVFLPYAFWRLINKIRSKQSGQGKQSIFVLVWFLVVFGFFTVSSTKLVTYIFPCFMSLALMTAVLWDDFLRRGSSRAMAIWMKASYLFLVAGTAIGAIGLLIFVKIDYPGMLGGVFVSGVFLVFGFILSLVAFFNKKYLWTFALMVYAVAIFLYPLSSFVLPAIEPFESCKLISQQLLKYMKPGEKLASESHYRPGLSFYTGKLVIDVDRYHLLVDFLGEDKRNWTILKEKNHRHVYELDTKPFYRRASFAVYQIGKKVIVTNMMPEDGKYIIKRERVL